MIIGTWSFKSKFCDGDIFDCIKKNKGDNGLIYFASNDTGEMQESAKNKHSMKYSIRGRVVTIKFKEQSVKLYIHTMTDQELIWWNCLKKTFQGLSKYKKENEHIQRG